MNKLFLLLLFSVSFSAVHSQKVKFNDNWFFRVDTSNNWDERALWEKKPEKVTLPHDWSIEQPFDKYSPSGNRGASLRGGLGIYEKRFVLSEKDKGKNIFIIFDGVYMNSTVTINGHILGTRPFGYISFEYELTPYLNYDGKDNLLTVRVENKQPNSRWYSGSGIYRNVWLDKRGDVYIKNWGTYVATPVVTDNEATINLQTRLVAVRGLGDIYLSTSVYDNEGKLVTSLTDSLPPQNGALQINHQFVINQPRLWSTGQPDMYNIVSEVKRGSQVLHSYHTRFGVRSFYFDKEKGFFLNGKHLKIIGACMHHDLGALGAAINVSAMRRQLQLLKSMGINGIRTSHNPPAPEWLDLCDEMGLLVMDETFDVWTWDKEHTPFNYNRYFYDWHERDLSDHIIRDRNHPSVIMWSIGNEIPEQNGRGADTIGRTISRNLAQIIKRLDTTRPVTAGLNATHNSNNMYLSGALDIIGINYHHKEWAGLGTQLFPGNKPYILAENVSALATREVYDMPSDSIRRWAGFTEVNKGGNADLTCSAYENCSAPWASTNEEALKLFLKYPYLSGMYLWTGFDYLGEPTPYPFPARSSYFGIIDMAGFPKDAYYLYKSIFTKDTVLHILPHWNWDKGQRVDVHVYFNNADEVELLLNGKLLGRKRKTGDDLFVRFNGITYQPGTLKAVSKLKGKKVAESVVRTAGDPYKIVAEPDAKTIHAGGEELCFIKVSVLDKNGNLVPHANNKLYFDITGEGTIAALDNGLQTDLEPFSNKKFRNAFNGLALAIVRPGLQKGAIEVKISSGELKGSTVNINVE